MANKRLYKLPKHKFWKNSVFSGQNFTLRRIYYAPRLAEGSKAGREAFYVLEYSDLYQVQGPPGDPFLPLTNDIAFPRNITSAKTVYPGLSKSYNRHMTVLFCPSVRNAHSTHLKFKTVTYTPKRVF